MSDKYIVELNTNARTDISYYLELKQELTALRAWKEKARPFLESEYQSLKMRLESKDSDNTVHHSIRLECQMDLNLLTELLKENE